jgi:outer membrane protein
LVVVPQFSYYGNRFFLDNLDVGFTAAESATTTLSFIASPGYDRVFFYRDDLQNIFVSGFGNPGASRPPTQAPFPPRTRRITYLAGPEWTFAYHDMSGQFDILHEVTGHNHGTEVRAAMGIPLTRSAGLLQANLGVTWQSAAIVNYYFGATKIYQAGSVLRPFLKLAYTRPLRSQWRIDAFVQYERLGAAVADSPIVAKDYVATVFIGCIYAF